jgi:hypothetical protein
MPATVQGLGKLRVWSLILWKLPSHLKIHSVLGFSIVYHFLPTLELQLGRRLGNSVLKLQSLKMWEKLLLHLTNGLESALDEDSTMPT